MINVTVTRNTLEGILEHAGILEARYGYSGRGMYGARCFGIVGTAGDLVRFATSVAGALWTADGPELDRLHEAIREEETREDSMGFRTIYYWPHLAVTEADGSPAEGDYAGIED